MPKNKRDVTERTGKGNRNQPIIDEYNRSAGGSIRFYVGRAIQYSGRARRKSRRPVERRVADGTGKIELRRCSSKCVLKKVYPVVLRSKQHKSITNMLV